jgi:hypothetical protein
MTISLTRAAIWLAVCVVAFASVGVRAESESAPEVTAFKSRTCGCCNKWVRHLEENGFAVRAVDVPDLESVKRRHGVPTRLAACHTAVVDGYVIEGHVPASDVQRLLRERPPALGVAVPGMPMGSPGMEGAFSEPYEVLLFDAGGRKEVYARH